MKPHRINPFAFVIALCALAANAFAASPIWVSNTSDSGKNSLRAAITKANTAGGGEIDFSVTGTITLLSPLPSLSNITITGPGTNLLRISGGGQVRVFCMDGGTSNTLSGLTIADGVVTNGSYPAIDGGAGISNAGSLKLLNCAVSNCAVWQGGNTPRGGGIYNAGDLLMNHCEVTGCAILGDGGEGGGIFNAGDLNMEDCAVSSCEAKAGSGGGAGIFNAENLLLTNCVIESCLGHSECDGGGILSYGNLTVDSCTVSNCFGFWGGGIESWGDSAITNSTIIDNSSVDLGGGLVLGGTNIMAGCTIAGNWGAGGGGIYNDRELTMLNCTVSGNMADRGGGIASGYLYYGGTNATIYADHCTIVSNTAAVYGTDGGGVYNEEGIFHCQGSILAGNDTNDFSGVLTSEGYNLLQNTNDCTITGDPTGNIYGTDPLLGPLQDNGGPTWTHALLPGSPAIDAGSSVDTLAVDQRGIHRPQGLAPDIGAFEFQYATPVLVRLAVQSCTNHCLELCGLSGGFYTLQASTNLVNWLNVATAIADTNGLCAFTEASAATCSHCFYRVSLPVPAGAVYLPAPSGIVAAPFMTTNTYIWQTMLTGVTDGGRAEYPFIVPRAGDYVLQSRVNAPDSGANSLFVNIDAEPQDPAMIWDVSPYTSTVGFEPRTVNWRGDGTDTADQFVPIVFTLSQGSHKLIIRGREANTLLQDIAVLPYP